MLSNKKKLCPISILLHSTNSWSLWSMYNKSHVILRWQVAIRDIFSMAECQTVVTPLLMHWSYHRFALSHRSLWETEIILHKILSKTGELINENAHITENQELSWCQLCHHWWHWKLSKGCADGPVTVTQWTVSIWMQLQSSKVIEQLCRYEVNKILADKYENKTETNWVRSTQ